MRNDHRTGAVALFLLALVLITPNAVKAHEEGDVITEGSAVVERPVPADLFAQGRILCSRTCS
jgi:hypothetical protein